MSSPDKKSIVILSFDTLGDLILRQPLFTTLLDEGYPITVVVRDGYRGILPLLDRRLKAITTKINPYPPANPEVLEQAKELYQKIADVRPDTLVSAPYHRTYLDDWLAAQFRKSNRVGFLNPALSESPRDPFFATPDRGSIPSSELFTRLVQVAEDSHEGIKNQSLLEALLGRPSQKYHPTIKVTADLERQAEDRVSRLKLQPGRYVLGCPAGTVNIPIKFWPEKDYVDLLAHIHDKHQLPVLLTGLPEESSFLERIASEANKRGVACQRWIGSREDPSSLLGLIRHSCLYLGTDSGPMHLAAALDVPVVALFGGGTWPRFLPLAKRSFVATQEVACFGCNWECWLDEPICVRKVPVQKFCDGLDWILSSAKDERRVDRGEKPEKFSEEIIRRSAPRTRARIERLQTQLHVGDLDRAARTRMMDEMAAKLEASEADRASRLEVILSLQRQIMELATTKASLKRVAAAVARRLGIFHFLKRRQQRLERVYDVLYRMVSRAQEGPPEKVTPAQEVTPVSPLDSPEVEAFIVARTLEGAIEDGALAHLFQMGSQLKHVLCPSPSQAAVQAAYMLSSAGTRMTLTGVRDQWAELQSNGVVAITDDLAQWMVETKQGMLTDFDGFILDASCNEDALKSLEGRLSSNAMVLIPGAEEESFRLRSMWRKPEQQVGNLQIYESPPKELLDPVQKSPEWYVVEDWPWKSRRFDLPETLPSGRPWPKISVVTVTYNQGEYLEETLRSVLMQGYPNLEYLVLDGLSTDKTPSILSRYRKDLDYCVSEKDEGQSDALDKGFSRATGDILAWLNSDDRYPPGTLMRVALAFDAYNADIVVGGCALVHDKNPKVVEISHSSMPLGQTVPLPLNRLLDIDGCWLKGDFFWQPEVFWTRSIWERSGARVTKDLYYSMDYDLWVRMARAGATVVHIPDTLAIFRQHQSQKTSGEELPYLPELRQVSGEYVKGLR